MNPSIALPIDGPPDGSIHHVISAPFQTGGDVVGDGQHLWVSAIDDRLVIRLDVPAEA